MRFHFAAVPVHGNAEVERELNVFLGSHRVLGVERHLVADGAQSVWAICVSHTDMTPQNAASHGSTGPRRSRGNGCAVERTPTIHLSGSRTW